MVGCFGEVGRVLLEFVFSFEDLFEEVRGARLHLLLFGLVHLDFLEQPQGPAELLLQNPRDALQVFLHQLPRQPGHLPHLLLKRPHPSN